MQLKLSKLIVSKILKAYDLKLHDFKVFPDGIENTSLLVATDQEKYVLRVYRKNKKRIKAIVRELSFMGFLSTSGIPIPRVFKNVYNKNVTQFKSDSITWNCILLEFAKGMHPKRYSQKAIKDLARIQAHMHILGKEFAKKISGPKPYWTHLREKSFSPYIAISKIKNSAVKDFVIRAKQCTYALPKSLPTAYNHLDITHDNILVKNNEVSAVLDFDDARYSPTVICLGYTLWDMLYITRDARNIFIYLSAYTEYRKLTTLEIATLKDILLFRNYVIGTMEIMFYGENGNEVKPILKFEEIINGLNFL